MGVVSGIIVGTDSSVFHMVDPHEIFTTATEFVIEAGMWTLLTLAITRMIGEEIKRLIAALQKNAVRTMSELVRIRLGQAYSGRALLFRLLRRFSEVAQR